MDTLLRIEQVSARVGLKRSAIYARVAAHQFPKPLQLSKRCNVWPESAINSFIEERVKGYQPIRQAV